VRAGVQRGDDAAAAGGASRQRVRGSVLAWQTVRVYGAGPGKRLGACTGTPDAAGCGALQEHSAAVRAARQPGTESAERRCVHVRGGELGGSGLPVIEGLGGCGQLLAGAREGPWPGSGGSAPGRALDKGVSQAVVPAMCHVLEVMSGQELRRRGRTSQSASCWGPDGASHAPGTLAQARAWPPAWPAHARAVAPSSSDTRTHGRRIRPPRRSCSRHAGVEWPLLAAPPPPPPLLVPSSSEADSPAIISTTASSRSMLSTPPPLLPSSCQGADWKRGRSFYKKRFKARRAHSGTTGAFPGCPTGCLQGAMPPWPALCSKPAQPLQAPRPKAHLLRGLVVFGGL
jgi:hypothetical protein